MYREALESCELPTKHGDLEDSANKGSHTASGGQENVVRPMRSVWSQLVLCPRPSFLNTGILS